MQRDPETFAIIGAAMEVHRELGHGFLELVYQTALALEFQDREIPFAAEIALPIKYKSKLLTCAYRADFICFKSVIVETEAIAQLTGADDSQLINQLVFGSSDNLRKSVQSVDDTSSQSAAEIYL